MYLLIKGAQLKQESIELVSLQEEDIFKIKDWRNEQLVFLRQTKPLTEADQKKYFKQVIKPTFALQAPPLILLSILEKGVCIGYGGLVHIDWGHQRAEVSFLLETSKSCDPKMHTQYFKVFLDLIKYLAFKHLHLHRLYTETFDIRSHHIKVLEQTGFVLEGRLKDHIKQKEKYIDSLIHGCINLN